jgi:hypothetical protein
MNKNTGGQNLFMAYLSVKEYITILMHENLPTYLGMYLSYEIRRLRSSPAGAPKDQAPISPPTVLAEAIITHNIAFELVVCFSPSAN